MYKYLDMYVSQHPFSLLQTFLARRMREPRDVFDLLLAATDLLCCLLRHGVRHNDLWSSNILVVPADGVGDDTLKSRVRLVAIDFEAAELTEDGLYDFVDEALSLGGNGSPLSRARDFLRDAGVHAVELPPLAPTFHVAEGLAEEVALQKWTDRGMLGSVLKHHLFESADAQHLAVLAGRFRHIVEALLAEGDPQCEVSDAASCKSVETSTPPQGWRLQDIRAMLLLMA